MVRVSPKFPVFCRLLAGEIPASSREELGRIKTVNYGKYYGKTPGYLFDYFPSAIYIPYYI